MGSIFGPPVPNLAVLEVQDLREQATKLKARALKLVEWVWEDIVEALGLKIVRKKKRGRQKGAVNKKDAAKREVLMTRYEVETQKLPATDAKISKRLAKDLDLCRQLDIDIKGTAIKIRANQILQKIRSAKKRLRWKRLLEKADPQKADHRRRRK
jgi:hypothetical protein